MRLEVVGASMQILGVEEGLSFSLQMHESRSRGGISPGAFQIVSLWPLWLAYNYDWLLPFAWPALYVLMCAFTAPAPNVPPTLLIPSQAKPLRLC